MNDDWIYEGSIPYKHFEVYSGLENDTKGTVTTRPTTINNIVCRPILPAFLQQ